jgi:nitrate/nitrite transporter NarK
MGLINAIGNLGGFLGPFLIGYLFTLTGSNVTSLTLLAVALAGTGLLTFFFPYGGASQMKESFSKEVSAEEVL